MNIPRLLLLLALLLCLPACEPFVPVIALPETARRDLQTRIPVYDASTLEATSYERLGTLDATSCKLGITDASASAEDAVDQLRYKATALGGNALTDILCEPPQGMSLSKNCWNSVICHGVAIVMPPRRK